MKRQKTSVYNMIYDSDLYKKFLKPNLYRKPILYLKNNQILHMKTMKAVYEEEMS